MAQPTDTTKLGKSFFHAFSKTQTESTQYVFESLYKSAHSLRGSDVWAEDVPYAVDATAADNNATAYPTRIKKYTLTSLTEIPGSNGQAWYLNDGGKFVRPWISPTDIPNTTTNDPSYGYQARLYKADNTQIMPASGVWMIDYYAGLILFEPGSTPVDLGYGNPKITCYNYTGASLSSTGAVPYLYQLKDVQISSTGITDGFILTYNTSTGKWIAAKASSIVLWTASTQYYTDDQVIAPNNRLYRAFDDHVSTANFNDDMYTGGHWVTEGVQIADWTPSTAYEYRDLVYYTGIAYVSTHDQMSRPVFFERDLDDGDWIPITTLVDFFTPNQVIPASILVKNSDNRIAKATLNFRTIGTFDDHITSGDLVLILDPNIIRSNIVSDTGQVLVGGAIGGLTLEKANPYTVTNPNTIQILDLTSGTFAFVAGGTTQNIYVYSVNNYSLDLTPITGSPFANGHACQYMVACPNNKFLYVSGADGTLTGYTIDQLTGSLTPIVIAYTSGAGQVLAVTYDSKYLYVVDAVQTVTAWEINPADGTLTHIVGPFTIVGAPDGCAVTPDNAYLYTVQYSSGDIMCFSINPGTGALTPVGGFPIVMGTGAGGPAWVSITPDEKYLYVNDYADNYIYGFSINPGTGALTAVPGSPFTIGIESFTLSSISSIIDSSSSYLYLAVAQPEPSYIAGFNIDSATGTLTPIGGSPFYARDAVWFVASNPSETYMLAANTGNGLLRGSISAYWIIKDRGTSSALHGNLSTTRKFLSQTGPQATLGLGSDLQTPNIPEWQQPLITDLGDVNISGLQNKQALIYDSPSGKWINSSTGVYTDEKVLADATDTTPGYLDAKVDGSTLEVDTTLHQMRIKDAGILPPKLDAVGSPADNLFVSYISSTGQFLWTSAGGVSNLYQLNDVNITSTGSPNGYVLTYNTSTGKWIASSTGVYASNVNVVNTSFIMLTGDDQQEVDDEIDGIFSKLIPPKPANLSTKTITMTTYTAKQSGTGTDHTCTDDTTPSGSANDHWDGVPIQGGLGGILTAEIDSIDSGNRQLSDANDVGDYGNLHITADEDPYVGQPGRENFWHQIDCNITPAIALTFVQHTYRLLNSSTSGNTPLFSFWVDDPGTTTITVPSKTFPGAVGRYISGVPSLATGDIIRVNFTVNNAAQTHYCGTRVASITCAETTDIANILAPSIPNNGDPIAITNQNLTVETARYIESCIPAIYGYNSKNVAGTVNNFTTNARIDTTSSETTRVIAGSGQYPAVGYGGAFNSTQSLTAVYTEELMVRGGVVRWPLGNYIANEPTAGPDYSAAAGAWRYFMLSATAITNATGFTVNFIGAVGFGASVIVTNLRLYARVDGGTPTVGWVDGNAAYGGVGNPTNNGDPACVVGSSTATSHRITFGAAPKTGNLFVRVGIPTSDAKTWANITITGIS